MSDTNEIIAARTRTHGRFSDVAKASCALKAILRTGPAWIAMNDQERESADMIVHKLARIISGNPHEEEHWDDIAGYAKIARKDFSKDEVA
jgi:hypothetical protein